MNDVDAKMNDSSREHYTIDLEYDKKRIHYLVNNKCNKDFVTVQQNAEKQIITNSIKIETILSKLPWWHPGHYNSNIPH